MNDNNNITGGVAPNTKSEPSILDLTEKLNNVIEDLETSIDFLTNVMEPIMKPEYQKEAEQQMAEYAQIHDNINASDNGKFHQELHHQIVKIESLKNRVRLITQYLQL